MKKQLMCMGVVLLLCGVAQAQVNVWGLFEPGQQNMVEGRIGYRISPILEAGLSGAWTVSGEETCVLGVYGIVTYPDPIEIPNPWPGPQETIKAQAYGGFLGTVDFDNDRNGGAWLAGTIIENLIVIEYRSADFSDQLSDSPMAGQWLMVGVCWEIP